MKTKLVKLIKHNIISNLESVEVDIINCPDDLWEKKYGGDFYWHQVYHVLAGTIGMLPIDSGMPEMPIPEEVARLEGECTFKGPHDKEIMLDMIAKTKEHAEKYFSKLHDSMLFEEVDFFGHKMALFTMLEVISNHIMYHVGAFDAALRDNNAPASM